MNFKFIFFWVIGCPVIILGSANSFQEMLESFEVRERMISEELKNNLENSSLYSSRGDMNLFLGRFEQARSDYEMMIQIKPELEVSHWRLGIAYYYLGDFEKAAKQFESYHNYDAVDRENGIWRFMSQFKKSGLEEARKGLLKYEKGDRPPYPLLYEMFAGRLEPEKVFTEIEQANYSSNYKTRVLFHATLYVGIYLELVENNQEMAKNLLKKAFENKYGQSTGTYMWQVARLHYHRLLAEESFPKK
ncbi:MAG: hypothetical protein VX130_05510 [Verrucomicrobiota bacterium]|nr:hypothetical protein [Verrucomicrobiota bacterium]